MESFSYSDFLKRRAYLIVIVALVAVIAAAGIKYVQSPVYTAQATLRVILNSGLAEFRSGEDYNTRLLNTYQGIIQSDLIMRRAIEQTNAPVDMQKLKEGTFVGLMPDTELIIIAVDNESPKVAMDLANALASNFIDYTKNGSDPNAKGTVQVLDEEIKTLQANLDEARKAAEDLSAQGVTGPRMDAITRQIDVMQASYTDLLGRYETAKLSESLRENSISVISWASSPEPTSNTPSPFSLGLGLLAGVCGGLVLASAVEKLDKRVHSASQAENIAGLPVLGSVPQTALTLDQLRTSEGRRDDRAAEAYRLLGTNLGTLSDELQAKTLLLTSIESHSGKSAIVANLARTLAELGRITILVESDLRSPSLSKHFGGLNGYNLGNLLASTPLPYETALSGLPPAAGQPNLFVICGGARNTNPAPLLASPAMKGLIKYVRNRSDITVLDSPPVLTTADTSVLAPKVDGVVLLVEQSTTTRDDILEALRQLRACQANVLGLVLAKK